MDHLSKAINEYCKSDKDLELEIRFTVSVTDFRKIYKNICDHSKSFVIEQSLNAIININNYTNNRYEVYFDKGIRKNTIYIQKRQLSKAFLKTPLSCKVSIAEELPIPEFSASRANFIRLKYRKSIILPNNNWRADFTLVKNIEKNQFSNIESIKNDFFSMPESIFLTHDQCEFELEYIGNPKHIKLEKNNEIISVITSVAKIINPDTVDDPVLTQMLAEIVQLLKIQKGDTLKQIANQPKNLNFTEYQLMIPKINNYYLSDKADGERGFLYCTDKCRIILTSSIITLPDKSPGNFLLDVEVFKIGESIKMYAFDMLICDSEPVYDLPFSDRLKKLESNIEKFPSCELKIQVQLNESYSKQISCMLKRSSRLYDIDGLIFTPNENYFSMSVYKWKPPERQTIDFLVVKPPDSVLGTKPFIAKPNHIIMFLFSGISPAQYKKLMLRECPGYRSMFKYNHGSMFPTAFQPTLDPYAYIYHHPNSHKITVDNLNNHVAEFIGSIENNQCTWTIHTLRPDRDSQVSKGIGYGNYFTTAEDIYAGYYDPFTTDKLLNPHKYSKTIYFGEQKLEIYKPLTKFNAFVKAQLIRQLENSNFLIDLAAGKGQDLFTIHGFGIKNALFVDVSAEAIAELNKRKYDLGNKRQYIFGYNPAPMKIYTKVLDLTTPCEQIVNLLSDVPIVQADGIIMNFAIHYIVTDQPSINNLITLINTYLKSNGLFIFTCFDGARIFEMLQNTLTDASYDLIDSNNTVKYSIKKLYSDTEFKPGLKISVIHPFSKGEYYEENLIDIKWLISVFKQNSYTVIQSGSFSDWLDKFSRFNQKIYSLMSLQDKQYASLYSYITLCRN